MNEVANFFWEGKISVYERMALKSFVQNDFDVRIWSYNEIRFPGTTWVDANLILSKDFFEKFKFSKDPESVSGNLAAFANIFRVRLLTRNLGEWWFDIDCVCLKNQSEFKKLKNGRKIVVGWQDTLSINNACLSFIDKLTAEKLSTEQTKIIEEQLDLSSFLKTVSGWSELGARLITEFVKQNNLIGEVIPAKVFYPVHYNETPLLINPLYTKTLQDATSESHCFHLWNETFTMKEFKHSPPPEGSFLDFLLTKFEIQW